jgi:hypothetical protein
LGISGVSILFCMLYLLLQLSWNLRSGELSRNYLLPRQYFVVQPAVALYLLSTNSISSGYPYPVPLYLIPSNVYLTLRFIYSILVTPKLSAKKSYLREHGIANPLNVFSIYQPQYLWLSQSLPEIDFPISVIPESVVPCGPIYLSVSSAADQDPDLASWLQRAPTVLINLGSNVDYDEVGATEMAKAIKMMLEKTQVQVLWKFNKRREFRDEFLRELEFERILGRLRLESWLGVDPASLLETGDVVVSVHHGGANCYHEAVGYVSSFSLTSFPFPDPTIPLLPVLFRNRTELPVGATLFRRTS